MSTGRTYTHDYKVQAIKLAYEIGQSKAAKELGISSNTVSTWVRNARIGKIDIGDAVNFDKPLSASERLAILEKENKALKKKIADLEEKMYFLKKLPLFLPPAVRSTQKRKDELPGSKAI